MDSDTKDLLYRELMTSISLIEDDCPMMAKSILEGLVHKIQYNEL